MADLSAIESAFLTDVAAISGIESTSAVEPLRLDQLPAVTMMFIGCPQVISSTGYSTVQWMWRVSLTVKLTDLAEAQNKLKTLIPALLAVTRANPSLSGTCEWADLNDRLDEPTRIEDMAGWRKDLYLTVTTTEAA